MSVRILAIALLLAAVGARADGLSELERERLAAALACVNMSIEDLGWDKRPIEDPFRLAVVNRALDEPLALAEMAETAGREISLYPPGPDFEGLVDGLEHLLGARPAYPEHMHFRIIHNGRHGSHQEQERSDSLPELASFILSADDGVRDACSETDRTRLRADAARAYLEESEEPWDTAPFRDAASRVDLNKLDFALRSLGRVASHALALPQGPAMRPWRDGGLVVLVSGPGDDHHENVDVIVDTGGNDTYANCRVVIDFGGDDTYRDCGSGFMQAGLIVDRAGNDRYLGGDITQGGAVCGVALLVDVAGDDFYDAGQLSQGAGVLGFGVLIDLAGNDIYRGARFVQGFGGVRGLGLLLDQSGEDTYLAGGRFKHEPLLPENYQSLSQGFGFGLRPDASGGVGLLVDQAGNDSYHAEVFGQGASYWFSLGMLIDSAGHDKYDLYQYGQGAGIHLSAGILMDVAGNDGYTCNNGVAQGSGHDWGVGMLWDRAGMDAYQGSGMSQGGANANGIGFLLDDAGNDSYAGWNERNQGDSFPSRGSVGLGVVLDLGGADKYTHGGADGATWTRGSVGVGMDWEPPKPVAPEEAKP